MKTKEKYTAMLSDRELNEIELRVMAEERLENVTKQRDEYKKELNLIMSQYHKFIRHDGGRKAKHLSPLGILFLADIRGVYK